MNSYPTISEIKRILRLNIVKPFRRKIFAAYIIGSEANGTAKSDSDLDIALVIEKIKGKTSLSFSEVYHSSFKSDFSKPMWNNKRLDFQFFYEEDSELENINKIQLK